MTSAGAQIIFLDHFKHPSAEGDNQDLVRFPTEKPYIIEEVRVVPKGFPVKGPTKIITGYSDWLTSPDTFEVKIFLNNLNLNSPSRCQWVGTFNFNESSTHRFLPNARFPTDALVVRGRYGGLTLAVLGVPAASFGLSPITSPVQAIQKPGILGSPPVLLHQQTARIAMPPTGNLLPPGVSMPAVVVSGAPIPTIGGSTGGIILPHVTTTLPAAFNPSIPPPSVVSGISAGNQVPIFSSAPGVMPVFDPTRPPPPVISPQQPGLASAPIPSTSSSRRIKSSRRERKEKEERSSTSGRKEEESRKRGRREESKKRKRDRSSEKDRRRRDRDKVREIVAEETVKKEIKQEMSPEGETRNSEATSQEKFDLENISDEEFEYVDGAGEVELTPADEEMLTDIVAGFEPCKFVVDNLKFFDPPWEVSYISEDSGFENTAEYSTESLNEVKAVLGNETLVDSYQTESAVWVEAMEKLLPNLTQGLSALMAKVDEKTRLDAVGIFSNWVTYGLDMEEAKTQTQPAFIIRHMKVGLKLASALVTFSPEICTKMIEMDIQHRILDLIEQNQKVPSLVLQILKALESTTFYKSGMDALLNQKCLCYEGGPLLTPYQRLSEFAKRASNSRILVATKALVKKVSVHETLTNLRNSIDRLVQHRTVMEDADDSGELTDEEAVNVSSLLQQLLFTYRNAEDLMTVNRFHLPVSKIYEVRAPKEDPYPSFYQMMKSNCLLESLTVICSNGGGMKRVVTVMKRLLDEFIRRLDGLLCLGSRPEVTQNLLKILLQTDGDAEEGSPLSQVGMDLVHHLQGLKQVDHLLSIRKRCLGDPHTYIDNVEAVAALQQLMKLTYTPQGRKAAVKVLGWKRNLDSILPFVELTGDPEVDSRARKSACAAYAADLLLLTIRCSDSVELLQNFTDRLLTVSSQESFSRIGDLRNWVEVLRKLPDFSVNSVEYLCDKINGFVQEGIASQLPKGLIVVLRILRFLVEAPKADPGVERTEELKYKHALMKMYGKRDTFRSLILLITKLVDSHLINWQQGLSMNNQEGQLFYACVLPALRIIRVTITELIRVRKDEFQDLGCVRPLVHLFTVCTTMLPAQSVSAPETKEIQKDVVQTLLACTQPISASAEEGSSGKQVEKSLWTRMVKEILKYRAEAPFAFVGATTVLAELLPVPLPIQSAEELSKCDVEMAVANRRAWSAHLQPLEAEISNMITELVEGTHVVLKGSFRKLALFLADLTVYMAKVVVRSILNSALRYIEVPDNVSAVKKEEENKDEGDQKHESCPERKVQLPTSASLARILDTLSYLCSQPPFKVVVLGLMRSEKEVDAQYRKMLDYFFQILSHRCDDPAHNRSKECIVSMLFQFCDYEISLLGSAESKNPSLDTVVGSLPSRQQLKEIAGMLLRHLGCAKDGFQITFVHSLRALLLTLEHDLGLDMIREVLLEEPGILDSLLTGIMEEFVKRKKNPSSDCCASLNLTMDFVKTLIHRSEEDREVSLRKQSLDYGTLRKILDWKEGGIGANQDHPLVKLASLLEQSITDDETMRSYLEPVKEVVAILDTVEAGRDAGEWSCAEFPECCLSLEEQFSQRQIWMLVPGVEEEQHRLTPHYWFPSCAVEELAEEAEITEPEVCDLESLRQEVLPQFDPKEDLLRRVSAKHVERPTKRPKHRPGIINTSRGEKKGPPLRGRGFVPRGPMTQRVNDPFRNRPQNTSRAPSMHVDDFLIMEFQSKKAHDQNPQAGKVPMRPDRSTSNNRSGNPRGGERRLGRSKSPALGMAKDRGGHKPAFGRTFYSSGNYRRGVARGGMRFHGRNRDREYRGRQQGVPGSANQRHIWS